MQAASEHIFLIGILFITAFVAFMLLCVIDFYSRPVVRHYKITTDKLSEGQVIKIVLVADLHSYIYGENQHKLIDWIKKENPDVIALAGDIADDKRPINGTEQFLKGAKNIAPIYYVTGNHEFRSKYVNAIKALFRRYNVNVLEHQYKKIQVRGIPIIIGGVDDPFITKYKNPKFNWEKEMYKAFSNLDKEKDYKILLSHRPERIMAYKNTAFDLVLSGHAHGGQVRIPFVLNGLFAPNQGLFPKYAGGIYQHDKLIHIISRGISQRFFRPRVFNPPELVVIEVEGTQK